MIAAVSQKLSRRSAAVAVALETRFDTILKGWMLVAGLIATARCTMGPAAHERIEFVSVVPYFLVVLAPVASALLALSWFPVGHRLAQPTTRLAIVGRWRSVDRAEATAHPLYGPQGMIVSLLVGMLLNVPVRAAEYFAAMPPIPVDAPHWLVTLKTMMTLDVVIFSSLYTVAFIAALRRVPLFPRLLAAIWLADLAMQLGIAEMVSRQPGLPGNVATALTGLLAGNVKKVLIGMAIWTPYLLLSERVNVTYRSRVSA
ncbi:DUF2569 family protein [Sphingomonas sp. ASV193]|uniref:DUF2569 family protein n=1 Tax=Sphingomonas sp. ASV193 TaxID=3144405 RepID=UPI0032E9385E